MTEAPHRWDAPPLPPADEQTPDQGDLRDGWTQRDDGPRLAAVAALGAEQQRTALDAVAREVAADLDQPVALVSLVGRDGQEFAGAEGLTGWLAETRGTPVEWSLCRHVVDSGLPLVVEDARHDDRHRDNPLVLDGVVGSYAGVPLRHDGQLVGALCVISPGARRIGADEVARLTDHADRLQRRLAVGRPGGHDPAGADAPA